MKPEEIPSVGNELGKEALSEAEEHGEHYCRHERRRIEVANQPKIFALRTQCGHLKEQAEDVEARIHKAPPTGDERTRRRKMWWYRFLVALLSFSAFAFLIMAFEPFRMGWKGWLYSLGIAVLTPLLVDKTIDAWESRATILWRAIVTTACLAAFGAQLLLGVVRGNIMRQQVANPVPAIVIEEDVAAPESPQNNFYDESVGYLQLVMVLFAGALELGAGAAWREARRWGLPSGEDREALWLKLGEIRQEMVSCAYSASVLEGEGAAFEEGFRRDFDRSFLRRAQIGVLNKLLIGLIALLLLGQARAVAADRLNLVVAIDLSASVSTKGLDEKTECERNIVAVSKILASAPAGSNVTVVAITDRSFTSPYILLQAKIGKDEGYFKERLNDARQHLMTAWRKRSREKSCQFRQTDIFGSLFVISQLANAEHTVLVILSDMRHDMGGNSRWNGEEMNIQTAPVPLKDVEVHVLGVSGSGVTVAQWQRLRTFWTQYFQVAGAIVKSYSMLRDIPDLGH